MSFATPGMTHDMGVSNIQTQQPYFSNTGQIEFKPGVRIEQSFSSSNTSNVVNNENDPMGSSSISYAINGGKITATLKPSNTNLENVTSDSIEDKNMLDGKHNEVQTLSVAENSRRLARMICNKQLESNFDSCDNMPVRSLKSMNKYASKKYASNFNTETDIETKFNLLVKEFISNSNPDYETWIGLNPDREDLPIKASKNLYKEIKLRALTGSPKTSMKTNSTTFSNDSDLEHLQRRISTLEAEQKLLVDGGHQNRQAIRSKVSDMEKGIQMCREKIEEHGSKLKSFDSKPSLKSSQNAHESFAKTVSTPISMNLKAMSEAIAKA
jgi:hypothetical protein|tara:strand:- start:43 stop:1020 length:978 start_codon:yes stop_codon:yes gene_type:complete